MIRWLGGEFLRVTRAELVKRFAKAGVYFTSKERGYLNVGQPYRRNEQGGHVGLDPSKPGQFPHKLSGQLQRSVTWKLDAAKLVLTVGSNLEGYPKWLQTGTRFMKPRPWLSLGFEKEKDRIGRIIVGR